MRLLVFILLVLAIGSCKGKESTPSNVLSREKMETVMWDIMQVDQYLSDYIFNKDTSLNKLDEHNRYYQQVYALHKTNHDEFKRSFAYYRARPALMKDILDSLNVKPIPDIEGIKPDKAPDTTVQRKKFAPKVVPGE